MGCCQCYPPQKDLDYKGGERWVLRVLQHPCWQEMKKKTLFPHLKTAELEVT